MLSDSMPCSGHEARKKGKIVFDVPLTKPVGRGTPGGDSHQVPTFLALDSRALTRPRSSLVRYDLCFGPGRRMWLDPISLRRRPE
jgi:hypothetical protein